ncbi:MAG: hypothetical protein AAFR61_25220 [Bacteroidota bacterium]
MPPKQKTGQSSTFAQRRQRAQTRRMMRARKRVMADVLRNRMRSRQIQSPQQQAGMSGLIQGPVSRAFQLDGPDHAATAWRDARPNAVHLRLGRIGSPAANLGATIMAMADQARSAQLLSMGPGDRLVLHVDLNEVDNPSDVQRELREVQEEMAEEGNTGRVEISFTVDGEPLDQFSQMQTFLQENPPGDSSQKRQRERLTQIAQRLQRLQDMDRRRAGTPEEVAAMRAEADQLRTLLQEARITHKNQDLASRRNRPLDILEAGVEQRMARLEQDPARELGQYGRLPDDPDSGNYERLIIEDGVSQASLDTLGGSTQDSLRTEASEGSDDTHQTARTEDSLLVQDGDPPREGQYDRVPEQYDQVPELYDRVPNQYDQAQPLVQPRSLSQYGRVEQIQGGEGLPPNPDGNLYDDVGVALQADSVQSMLDDLVAASRDGNRDRSDNRNFQQMVILLRVLADLEKRPGGLDLATMQAFMSRLQALRQGADSTFRRKPQLRARRNQALRDLDRRLGAHLRTRSNAESPQELGARLRREGQDGALIRDLLANLPPDQQRALLQAMRDEGILRDNPPPGNPPPEGLYQPLSLVPNPYDSVGEGFEDSSSSSDDAPPNTERSLRLVFEGRTQEAPNAFAEDINPPPAPTVIAESLEPNPMLYFQPNAEGGINYRVDNEGMEVDWIQLERFCSILSTHWLTHGQGQQLGFADLNNADKQAAVANMISWAGQGGLAAQVQHAQQALGPDAETFQGPQAVQQAIDQRALPPGSQIWFATDQHAQAASVQPNGDFLVYDPNIGQARTMNPQQFKAYIQYNNQFVVQRGN